MAENKVRFGLKKLHYAVITDSGSAITYATPQPIPGAVSMTASPVSGLIEFEADDKKLYTDTNNEGYSGSIEVANIPETMLTEVFGRTLDTTSKTYAETANDRTKRIALLGEFDGDTHKRLWVFYNVLLSRPNWDGQTSRKKEPKTVTIPFVADPDPYSGAIKHNTGSETTASVISGWYSAVFTV